MKLTPRGNNDEKLPLESCIQNLIKVIIIPLIFVIAVVMGVLFWYGQHYNAILNNVTTASEFNQNFKNDIDSKMYYVVIESQFSEGVPEKEVEHAQALAKSLLKTTTEKDSIMAVNSVLKLCDNLKEKMHQIAGTDNFDIRQTELENNIYILTGLIQTYMYDYLYYEAAHLKTLQATMTFQMEILLFSILLIVSLLIAVLLLKARRLSSSITAPIEELSHRVKAISTGDLSKKEPVQANELEVQALSDGIEMMAAHLNELIEKNKMEAINLKNAELALLRAQINPHFLYNTLDTIIWLIETGDYDGSIQMVNSLSNFFRLSMSRGKDVITLEEEGRHISSYLEIQKIRYRNVMDYKIDIPKELWRYCLPKFTLQPLVENALYHGIKLKRSKGLILVTGRENNGCVYLTVQDNGAGMTPKRRDELIKAVNGGREPGFGLCAIHKRLKLMFGDAYGVSSIISTQDIGTKITVKIPMTLSEEGDAVT